jgi:glycosyltransferase involved in cell wall biosynthesis
MKALISIVTPCFNEESNVQELYLRVCAAIAPYPQYDFEIIAIDNASTDNTVALLKALALADSRLKIIVNTRNFGHIRSPYWGLMQASGAAAIYLASDLQDPPEKIPHFIEQWEKGWKLVFATKPVSETNRFIHGLRRLYYKLLDSISEVPIVKDSTGFGLYDRIVLNHLKQINDPYPYVRGLVSELGYPIATIEFTQPRRARGISKNNIYTLYDIAMLGIISHSVLPLRIAGMIGFGLAAGSFLASIFYFIYKLLNWNSFPLGLAPLVILSTFFFGVLFVFLGIIGEYIGSIHLHLKNRPVVVEKERINF